MGQDNPFTRILQIFYTGVAAWIMSQLGFALLLYGTPLSHYPLDPSVPCLVPELQLPCMLGNRLTTQGICRQTANMSSC